MLCVSVKDITNTKFDEAHIFFATLYIMKKINIPWSRIQDLLHSKKADSSLVKEGLGVHGNVITNWKKRGVPTDRAYQLAELFGVSVSVIYGESEPEPSNVTEAPKLREFKDVPVVGAVQAGDLGMFEELEYPAGYGDGFITYPMKDQNSYALRVRGDSMRPRIKSGEFIVVEPNTVAQNGDDVVVCTTDGRKMVKELLFIRDGEVSLGSINQDHPNITVQVTDIDKIHYVAAIIPRGAFYKI